MIIPLVLKLIRKTWDHWAEQLQGKQETQRLCELAPGTKADTVLVKAQGPFPCPANLLKKYLFIWLYQVLVAACRIFWLQHAGMQNL